MTNKMQQCRIIYCSLAAVHVSSDIFAHHQEHLNCVYRLWYYTRESLPAGCIYSLDAPDDERKYRSKHVEQPRNNKLSYTVASWSFSYISENCLLVYCVACLQLNAPVTVEQCTACVEQTSTSHEGCAVGPQSGSFASNRSVCVCVCLSVCHMESNHELM
jgi:hypothetical protein